MKFRKRLKELRIKKDLTQAKLALELNVSLSTIVKWESGITRPRVRKLLSLADYFDVSIDYLIGRTDS